MTSPFLVTVSKSNTKLTPHCRQIYHPNWCLTRPFFQEVMPLPFHSSPQLAFFSRERSPVADSMGFPAPLFSRSQGRYCCGTSGKPLAIESAKMAVNTRKPPPVMVILRNHQNWQTRIRLDRCLVKNAGCWFELGVTGTFNHKTRMIPHDFSTMNLWPWDPSEVLHFTWLA